MTGMAARTRAALSFLRIEKSGVEFIPENDGGAGVRLRKGDHMQGRQKLSRKELESRCLDALRTRPGLHDIMKVSVRAYSGPKSWTWEIDEASIVRGGAIMGQ